jgi:hypothetical protein
VRAGSQTGGGDRSRRPVCGVSVVIEAGVASERSERADEAPALVKHTERVDTTLASAALPVFCERPRRNAVWVFADGRVEPLRCESPNKCWYCAMLAAFENALVVKLDAHGGGAWPTMTITTTTAKPHWKISARELKTAEESLRKYLRRKYAPNLEWLGFVEWTTGEHARDGQRRVHVHHLVKGLRLMARCGECAVCLDRPLRTISSPLCELGEFTRDVRHRWHGYTSDEDGNGGAWRVDVAPLRTPAGALAYFALHHHKEAQKPPKGWSGKRFRPTRGYFNEPIPALRTRARALIFDERVVRQLVKAWDVPDGFDGGLLDDLLEEHYDDAAERARASAPTLHRVTRTGLVAVVAS